MTGLISRAACVAIVVAAVGAISCGGATTAVTSSQRPAPKTGETVRLGSWQYRVLEAYTAKSVDAGLYGTLQPKGVFVVIKLELTNLGQQQAALNSWDLPLLDHAGRSYQIELRTIHLNQSGNGQTALGQPMPPGISLTTMLLYDVNPEPWGWTLHLAQGNGNIELRE